VWGLGSAFSEKLSIDMWHDVWRILAGFGDMCCTSEGYCDLEHQLCQVLVCEHLSCEEACIRRCICWMDTAIWSMLDCYWSSDDSHCCSADSCISGYVGIINHVLHISIFFLVLLVCKSIEVKYYHIQYLSILYSQK
jgi:hypothetical protein